MFKIIFLVVYLLPTGPQVSEVIERPRFETMEACRAYGIAMKPRVEDWVRGRLDKDWDYPVKAVFECKPVGDPA